MESKEGAQRIKQIVEEKHKEWRFLEKKKEEDREIELRKIKMELLENEKKLRETGVVDLFKEIRDMGLVKLKHDVLAELSVCGGRATLSFDDTSGDYHLDIKHVNAYLEGDKLIIEGKERFIVSNKTMMVEQVALAILKPKIESRSVKPAYDYD